MLLANINLANTASLTACTCACACTYVARAWGRREEKLEVIGECALFRNSLVSNCSLLGCVGVVLQTYSAGSCGLLCKSGPHAVIRWFNIFLTKERVSRGRRRHNGWLFEVLVQGIHLPSNPFLLLQIFNCNYPQRSWIVAKINLRTCARDYLIRHSFARLAYSDSVQ